MSSGEGFAMRTASFVPAALVAGLLALSPAWAAAQPGTLADWRDEPEGPTRLDIGVSSGMLFSTDWSDLVLLGATGPVGGVLQQILVRDLAVTPGPVFDATVTYWRGRYGARFHGAYSRSCLAVGATCPDLPLAVSPDDPTLLGAGAVDVRTWLFDVAGVIGFTEYRRAQWARPYGFLGLGAVVYHPDEPVLPPLTFIDRPGVAPPVADPIVIIRDEATSYLLALQEVGLEPSLSVNFGIGTDLRLPLGGGGVGVRMELSDHITRSPLRGRLVPLDGTGEAGEVRFDFGHVHNLRFVAGLVLEFGG
jgi:hypothetical protein